MKAGESLTAQIQVVKVRRGQATVILIDGRRYVLEPNGK